MKIIDFKTVSEASSAYDFLSFEAGVTFAEQQLTPLFVEFAEWCTINYLHKGTDPNGKETWIDRDYYVDYKTTQQLFEEFIEFKNKK